VLIGALLATVLDFLRENPRFADLAAAAGFTGLGTVTGFAAAMFSLLAIPVGLYAATRIGTMAAEERARRWTSVFAAPVARNRLAAIETGATAAGAAVLLVVAGLAMWLGSTLTGAGLGAGAALAGALNVAPVALLGLGAAVLALGWLPSAVGAIGTVPVAGGFLLDVLARSAGAPNWVVGLSPFTHLAAVPDTAPDWPATAALTAVAAALAALAALGAVGYARRDLST